MNPTRTPTRTSSPDFGKPLAGWRLRLYTIVFEADTRAGRWFDLVLLGAIVCSIGVIVLESMASMRTRHGEALQTLGWAFTLLFTVEYLARLVCVRQPWRYARSTLGIIDLLSILPTYLAIFVPGLNAMMDVRVLRLLRIFRIFKLTRYLSEFGVLAQALSASRHKIMVFLSFVMMVVLVMGTLMFVVEGPDNGFTSIPVSVYWAITTMTTVGFGDITPKTDLGRLIASVMMLIGWGTLAVPTGIVTAEFSAKRRPQEITTRTCHDCLSEGHLPSAHFCGDCGAKLPAWQQDSAYSP